MYLKAPMDLFLHYNVLSEMNVATITNYQRRYSPEHIDLVVIFTAA